MYLSVAAIFALTYVAEAMASSAIVPTEISNRQATINCGSLTSVYVPTNMQGRVSSPYYPGYYPDNAYCIWVMNTDVNSIFTVTCDPMSISCNDYVQISPNGDTTFQSAYQAQCGFGPLVYNSTTNKVAIRFYSYPGTYSGFLQCIAVSVPISKPPLTTQAPTTTTMPTTAAAITTTTRMLTTAPATTTTTTKPTSPPTTTAAKSSTSPPCKCGIKGLSRVVGGQKAGDAEWPWQAMLVDKTDDVQYCGGTLIDNNWVITAAHCTAGKTANDIAVIVGQNNTISLTLTAQVRNVSKLIQHASFNATTVDNDIALLRLEYPVTYTSAVQQICLPIKYPGYEFTKQNGVVTGWGTLSYGGAPSSSLMEVTLPILNTTECKAYPNIGSKVTDNMICTYADAKDACQGDSGGPLNWQQPASSRVYLAGIVSFGIGCARPQTPGTYTKVTKYLNWITNQTGITFCTP